MRFTTSWITMWLCLSGLALSHCAAPGPRLQGVPDEDPGWSMPPVPPSAPSRGADPVDGAPVDDPLGSLDTWDALSTVQRSAFVDALAARTPGFAPAGLHAFECGAQRHELAVFVHELSGMEFVLVPGGTVEYPAGVEGVWTVSRVEPLLVARTEVTNGTWMRIMGETPVPGTALDTPAAVSFDDAAAFCRSAALGLPSIAQWEWSALGGTTTRYFCGDDWRGVDAYAWLRDNSENRVHPVARKPANAFGLHDVLGNVREWCLDESDESGRHTACGSGADSRAWSRSRRRPAAYRSWQYGFRPVHGIPEADDAAPASR